MGTSSALETLLKRDRLVVVVALVCVIAFSWAYILAGAGMNMTALEMTAVSRPAGLSGGYALDLPANGMVQDEKDGMADMMTQIAAPLVWTSMVKLNR